jgi:hypothetical protein
MRAMRRGCHPKQPNFNRFCSGQETESGVFRGKKRVFCISTSANLLPRKTAKKRVFFCLTYLSEETAGGNNFHQVHLLGGDGGLRAGEPGATVLLAGLGLVNEHVVLQHATPLASAHARAARI